MSYKSGETVYGGALVRSGWVIASDAYVNEPDCKVYNVNGRGGKVYDTDVLSNGVLNNTVVGAHASGSYGYIEDIRISNGGSVLVRSAGNVGSNITIYGGTLWVQSAATVKEITQNGGAISIDSGVTIEDVTYNGGTFNVTAGATVKNLYKIGATNINLYTGATVDGGEMYAGQLQALSNTSATSGATIKNYIVYGGLLIVRGTSNIADTIQVSQGGALHVQGGASGLNVDVYDGGTLALQNQTSVYVSSIRIHEGGYINGANTGHTYVDVTIDEGGSWRLGNGFTLMGDINFNEGALTNDPDATAVNGVICDLNLNSTTRIASGVTLSNFTQTGGALHVSAGAKVLGYTLDNPTAGGMLNLSSGGYVSGATITGNVGATNVVSVWTGDGVLEDVLTDGAGIYLAGGGTIRNVTQRNGALVILRGEDPYASGAIVSGGTLYFQNGAKGQDIVVLGGTLEDVNDGYAAVIPGSGALASGVDLVDGLINVSAGGKLYDLRASGGEVVVDSKSNKYGLAIVSGAVFTGGTLTMRAGTIVSGAEIGENASVTMSGGTLNIRNHGWNITQTGGTVTVDAGATLRNYLKTADDGVTDLIVDCTVDGGAIYGGTLQALVGKGADNAQIKNFTMYTGGTIILRGATNSAENITVSGGTFHVQTQAVARNVEVFDGGMINCGNGSFAGANVSALTIHSGGSGNFSTVNVNLYGLTLDAGAKLSLSKNVKISGGSLGAAELTVADNNYISGGATIDGLTITGGTAGNVFITDPYDSASGGAAYGQMVNRNMVVDAGASIFMVGANVTGSNATVRGWYYAQNGATISGAEVQSGGYINMWNRANYNDQGSRAKTIGTIIRSGGSAEGTDADFIDMTVEAGGRLSLNGGAGICGTENTIAQGALYVSGVLDADAYTDENHVLRNLDISSTTLNVKSGIALADLHIGHAGRVSAADATITGLDIEAPEQTVVGRLYLNGGAVVSGGRLNGTGTVNAVYMTDGAQFHDAHVSNGGIFMSANASMTDLDMMGGIVVLRGEQTYISGATITGGDLYLQNGGDGDAITVAGGGLNASDTTFTNPSGKTEVINNVVMTAGSVRIGAGATINKLHATGGKVYVFSSGTVNVGDGGSVNDLQTVAGAKVNFVENKNVATFTGENTNIAEGTLYFFGSAVAGHAANGVIEGFNADGSTVGYKLSIGSGIVLKDAVGNNTAVRVSAFDGAVVSGITLRGGAIICVNGADARVYDATLTGEMATCNLNLSAGAYASNTVVQSGGKIQFQHADAKADDTTIMAGGSMVMTAAADTGDRVTLDFTGTTGNQRVYITNLGNVKAQTEIVLKGETAGNTYTIANTGAADRYVNCDEWGLYEDKVKAGETLTNAFTGMTYEFNSAGTAITVSGGFVAATQAAAAKLADGATTLNGVDKAAKWDSSTTYTSNVFLADGMTTGNAWLDIDGFAASNANVYGAAKDQNFAGVVNIDADNGAVKNLAAGAGLGGSVAGVKLTVGENMNVTGAVYAGGMGDVTGATETLVEGGAFAGNVFAGALCNYAANQTATSAGDIAFTANGGTFNNNIYAGAAVKAGAATGIVHTAGDITVELNDGEATKSNFCVYGGGYATGSNAVKVYEAGGVDITVSGGSWGEYLSGRGIFGGVYADKVAASVDHVSIAVCDGTMGNIYGGGWAQNGGTSTVTGLVNITVTGDAEVDNVFGGGSYSSVSGGTTSVGSVNIRVDGGDIRNNIFAAGQNEYSTVAGDVSVVFTGSNGYTCNVYGYGVQASATVGGDKTLAFVGYTGELSGDIGGFDGIAISGDTAATLSGTTIDNDDWSFDYTDRTLAAATAALTFDGGSLTGDNVSVDLSGVGQAAGGWSIAAGLAAADATFGVELSTGSAANLALGDTLGDAYGIYEGWGFTLEDSTLKFKQLA